MCSFDLTKRVNREGCLIKQLLTMIFLYKNFEQRRKHTKKNRQFQNLFCDS
jgi:hypothetical protein